MAKNLSTCLCGNSLKRVWPVEKPSYYPLTGEWDCWIVEYQGDCGEDSCLGLVVALDVTEFPPDIILLKENPRQNNLSNNPTIFSSSPYQDNKEWYDWIW